MSGSGSPLKPPKYSFSARNHWSHASAGSSRRSRAAWRATNSLELACSTAASSASRFSRAIRTHLSQPPASWLSSRSHPIVNGVDQKAAHLRAFDKEDCRGREVVHRNFNIFKQWRAWQQANRGGAALRAITIWLTALEDMAQSVWEWRRRPTGDATH